MADKYVYRDATSGFVTEKMATVVGGSGTQAGQIVALDASGRIDTTILPVGIMADTYSGPADEGLSAGAFVYIKSNGSVANASSAVGGTQACGFVLGAFSAAATALVYFEGRNTSLSGLTVGTRYYLSDSTPGGAVSTPISGAGKRHQLLGYAVSTTQMNTEMEDSILLA